MQLQSVEIDIVDDYHNIDVLQVSSAEQFLIQDILAKLAMADLELAEEDLFVDSHSTDPLDPDPVIRVSVYSDGWGKAGLNTHDAVHRCVSQAWDETLERFEDLVSENYEEEDE